MAAESRTAATAMIMTTTRAMKLSMNDNDDNDSKGDEEEEHHGRGDDGAGDDSALDAQLCLKEHENICVLQVILGTQSRVCGGCRDWEVHGGSRRGTFASPHSLQEGVSATTMRQALGHGLQL